MCLILDKENRLESTPKTFLFNWLLSNLAFLGCFLESPSHFDAVLPTVRELIADDSNRQRNKEDAGERQQGHGDIACPRRWVSQWSQIKFDKKRQLVQIPQTTQLLFSFAKQRSDRIPAVSWRPSSVVGNKSPYPTDVIVTMASHVECWRLGMLLRSLRTRDSLLQLRWDPIQRWARWKRR